jgi:hypothetical protein
MSPLLGGEDCTLAIKDADEMEKARASINGQLENSLDREAFGRNIPSTSNVRSVPAARVERNRINEGEILQPDFSCDHSVNCSRGPSLANASTNLNRGAKCFKVLSL